MRIVQAARASAILYKLLRSRPDPRPWLVPANICPVVPLTFLKAGIAFELVDISAETLHMDLAQAEAMARTRRFGGVLYAHTYGEASTPNAFFRRLKELDESILVVDDRCLCAPDLQPEPSNRSDVQLYSVGYAKVGDLGSGGHAFLKDDVPYLAFHLPFDPAAYAKLEEGYKLAIKDRVFLKYADCDWLNTDTTVPPWKDYVRTVEAELERSLVQRARLNGIYVQRLPRELQLPAGYRAWRFNIRVADKARVLNAISGAGLFASSHYASLAGILAQGRCPRAESLHDSVVNLFNDRYFDEARAAKTCDVVVRSLT